MAEKQIQTNDKQDQQAQSPQQQPQSRQTALARREDFDFFGFPLNPFLLMRRMTEQMDRAFGDFWAPAIELSMKDGAFAVKAELAGMKPEEVRVEITGEALVIEGERKFEQEENRGSVHRTERRYGRFYRSIPLPEGADIEQARAKYENGMLEVTVPVKEETNKHRQIPVEKTDRTGGKAA